MKYARLQDHLQKLTTNDWEASFSEIEHVLGFSLPASACRYPAWWANQQDGNHSHAKSWMDAGWRTRLVRIRDKRITFERAGRSVNRWDEKPRKAGPSNVKRQPVVSTTALELPQSETETAREISNLPVIALVSCVKSKSNSPTKAKDLYLSSLFRKSREFVEQRGWGWYILSALYGLVDPESVIEPYDHSLNNVRKSEREKWSSSVIKALDDVLPARARVVLLAGERYSEFIARDLVQRGHYVDEPLKGLQLGRRLQFLGETVVLSTAE